jgi:gluconate 5-dehydrogenase
MSWGIKDWTLRPDKMFDLSGRVALVTGGGSGLGRAIALGLDAFGAHVVIADCNRGAAEEVAAKLQHDSLVVRTDVTQADSVREMVQTTLRRFARIDVSFNIAGINIRKPAVEFTDADWNSVIEVNLTGVFLCAREVGKVMLDQKKGSMINMASARGIVGGAHQTAYSATKAGVIQLTKCLAVEWAPHVRVNALAPGHVHTPLLKYIVTDPARYERVKNLHLMRRFAQPEEIVGPAVFLASDASSFMTGATLVVDGGWTAGQDQERDRSS